MIRYENKKTVPNLKVPRRCTKPKNARCIGTDIANNVPITIRFLRDLIDVSVSISRLP